jgi:hypothetical protein
MVRLCGQLQAKVKKVEISKEVFELLTRRLVAS